jgi:hypothetical protein
MPELEPQEGSVTCRPVSRCRLARGTARMSSSANAMVSSATASAFLPGVCTTGMPRPVAAATSTLTGPAPGAAHQPQRGRAEYLGADRRAVHHEHVVPGHGADHLGRIADVLAQPALGLGDRGSARDLVDLHRGQLDPAVQAGQGVRVRGHRHEGVADHQDAQAHG